MPTVAKAMKTPWMSFPRRRESNSCRECTGHLRFASMVHKKGRRPGGLPALSYRIVQAAIVFYGCTSPIKVHCPSLLGGKRVPVPDVVDEQHPGAEPAWSPTPIVIFFTALRFTLESWLSGIFHCVH